MSFVYDLVVSHRKCSDGIAACWVAKKYAQLADNVVFLDHEAGMPLEHDVTGKTVLMLDVVSSNFDDLAAVALHIHVVDHHVTNKKYLEKYKTSRNVTVTYSEDKCAAKIAWVTFAKTNQYPWWINVVDDRDRWVWTHEDSKALSKAIYCKLMNDEIDEFNDWSDAQIATAKQCGQKMLEEDQKGIDRMTSNAIPASFGRYSVLITSGSGRFFSEVGNILAKKCDIAAMWSYDLERDEWKVSLRSIGNVDVARIANRFGGGGHKHAAGFRIDGSRGNVRTVFSF